MENSLSIINNNRSSSYCSLKPETMEQKKALYNAVKKCDVKIADIVGQTIKVKDVMIRQWFKKLEDGSEEERYTTILFGDDGKTYVTGSKPFFFSISQVFTMFGEPDTWEEPLALQIVQQPVPNSNFKSLGVLVA